MFLSIFSVLPLSNHFLIDVVILEIVEMVDPNVMIVVHQVIEKLFIKYLF